jgi:hypothetical protein
MERESLRTGLNGSALTAWLASHDLVKRAPSPPSLIDGLGQWLGWTEAIALSASLNMPAEARAGTATPSALKREFDRVHEAMRRAIESSDASPQPTRRRLLPETVPADAGFAPYRQRYIALQQAMESAIETLRAQARAAAAWLSPRLAAVDAVMENMLSEREQLLLARLPTLLETHFERQRRAHADLAWIPRFRTDMQQLALAELQLRLQPVRGLIDTLSPR